MLEFGWNSSAGAHQQSWPTDRDTPSIHAGARSESRQRNEAHRWCRFDATASCAFHDSFGKRVFRVCLHSCRESQHFFFSYMRGDGNSSPRPTRTTESIPLVRHVPILLLQCPSNSNCVLLTLPRASQLSGKAQL